MTGFSIGYVRVPAVGRPGRAAKGQASRCFAARYVLAEDAALKAIQRPGVSP
jgi:hypothetical protein